MPEGTPSLDITLHRPDPGLLRILRPTPEVDEQHNTQPNAPAHDNGDFRGDVAGRVFGAEGLRADDVADAVWVVC